MSPEYRYNKLDGFKQTESYTNRLATAIPTDSYNYLESALAGLALDWHASHTYIPFLKQRSHRYALRTPYPAISIDKTFPTIEVSDRIIR